MQKTSYLCKIFTPIRIEGYLRKKYTHILGVNYIEIVLVDFVI